MTRVKLNREFYSQTNVIQANDTKVGRKLNICVWVGVGVLCPGLCA